MINIDYVLNNQTKKKFYYILEDDDLFLQYSIMEDSHLTLNYIKIKNKYNVKFVDVIKTLIELCKIYNLQYIRGSMEKGFAILNNERTMLNGYYSFLRIGFIPDTGINFINKSLKGIVKYENMEDIYMDDDFFDIWKEFGKPYSGYFDISKNSLSMIVFETYCKKI